MKTTYRQPLIAGVAVLAAVTALLALGCTQDILTTPDWKALGEADNPKYTNHSTTDYIIYPRIEPGSLGTSAKAFRPDVMGNAEVDRELAIIFPKEADFLRSAKHTSGLQSGLQKFMTIFTYEAGMPSPPGQNITYTVKRQEPDDDTVIITLGLEEILNSSNYIIKIDGAKYTYNGNKKMDVNGDGKAGDAVFDDYYIIAYVDGTSGIVYGDYVPPRGGPLRDIFEDESATAVIGYGYQNVELTITAGTAGTIDSSSGLSQEQLPVAAFTAGDWTHLAAEAASAAEKAELEKIAPKIKLEKRNFGGAWTTVTTAAFNNDEDTPGLIVTYTPEHDTRYRIVATKMKGLTTGEQQGVKHKIFVNDHYDQDTMIFYQDGMWTDTAVPLYPQTSVSITDALFSYDNAGKNVTINLFFDPIPVDATDYWLGPNLSLKDFNKAFKLAYSEHWDASLRDTKSADIVFLKLKSVNYSTNMRLEDPNNPRDPAPGTNCITMVLDPSVSIDLLNGEKGGTVRLLLSPNFKYSHDPIYFGNRENDDIVIDGVKCWEWYRLPGHLFN